MKKSHNKKRNVGIIYEQLILTVSRGIVKNNPVLVEKAKRVIKKHFVPGTELYKEFRLFNALVNTEISSKNKAVLVIENAKKDVLSIDNKKLNREKSMLIKEIRF